MNRILEALINVFGEKKLVSLLYVVYYFLDKYGKKFLDYRINDDEVEAMKVFCKKNNFGKKDIYLLLKRLIERSGWNVYCIEKNGVDDILLEGEKILKEKKDDIGIKIVSADGKVYKRFLLDDVKKLLKL